MDAIDTVPVEVPAGLYVSYSDEVVEYYEFTSVV